MIPFESESCECANFVVMLVISSLKRLPYKITTLRAINQML